MKSYHVDDIEFSLGMVSTNVEIKFKIIPISIIWNSFLLKTIVLANKSFFAVPVLLQNKNGS